MLGLPTDEIKRTLNRADAVMDESLLLIREVRETVTIIKTIGTAIAAAILAHQSVHRTD